ncbi:MAG: peptidoglycan D,D-transpeptidase FtsI family protein [Nocardioidaceae bacterium]
MSKRTPSGASRRPTVSLATGTFRLWSAFCAVAFVLSLFAARLIQLQGIDENDYAAMARATGAQTVTLEAPRAPIYDRFGVKLAETVDAAKLIADPTFTTGHATEIASVLHRRFGADYIDTVALLRTPGTRYVELARHLSPQVASSTVQRLSALGLPGVYTASDTMRVYPAGDVAASLIGFVKEDGTGAEGLEAALDDQLAGTDGSATYQVEQGQILPLAASTVVEPKEGTGVRLTLDEDLQFLAQRRLAAAVKGAAADSGVAVVMDTRTSQVLALADYPTYNANDPSASSERLWHSAGAYNAYEPGSVQKVLTFSALIDGGYVTPRTRVVVPPVLPVPGDRPINDYFYHGTLHLTTAGVVALSSNIGTVRSAAAMPNRELYRYLRAFRLGTAPDIGLPGLSPGTLGDPDTWSPRTRDTIDFGQSISVTALQMATAISAVANGGEYTAPALVEGSVSSDGAFTPAPAPEHHRVISPAAAQAVTQMMRTVVGPDGTASQVAIQGYQVAGKTGTAQRTVQSCHCYRGKTVSFGGFAPADNPRFVVYVVIQNPRVAGAGGGGTAGPVFHDLMISTLQKYGVPPTGQRDPFLPITW